MKSTAIAGVVLVLLMGCMAKSDLAKFPLCTEDGIQANPAMDAAVAVWEDQRQTENGYDIYGRNFSEPNELVICTAAGDQKYAAVSGDIVVWEDQRYGSKDIIGYDLATGEEFPICLNGANQQTPDISNGVVIWQDNRYGNWDIIGYDLNEGQEIEICTNASGQFYPAIDWPWVIWADNRNAGNGYDIYAKNLQTGIEVPVCTSAADQFYPDISDGLAVWQDKRNDSTQGTNIYARQLPDGVEFPVCTETGDQSYPAADGALITWEDKRNGTDFNIYAYDWIAQTYTAVCTVSDNQKQAAVCGSRILWQHQGGDLYYADVPVPTVLTMLWPNGGEMILAGQVMDIQWQTEGPAPDFVKINFSENNGANWMIVDSAAANTGHYSWATPADANSAACLIQISDVTAPLTKDASDGVFTIFQCDPSLTADLNGDCRVDAADVARLASQWLVCGNPHDPQWCFE